MTVSDFADRDSGRDTGTEHDQIPVADVGHFHWAERWKLKITTEIVTQTSRRMFDDTEYEYVIHVAT